MLTAVVATGLAPAEAIAACADQIGDWSDLRSDWLTLMGHEAPADTLAEALAALAAIRPDLATQALAQLPDGFRAVIGRDGETDFEGLDGCAWVVAFPPGFGFVSERKGVNIGVRLEGCLHLERLPERFRVDGWITLEGCSAWDRRIPADARIRDRIWTPDFPWGGFGDARQGDGVSLENYRDWMAREGL
jgi:hypothetical protein